VPAIERAGAPLPGRRFPPLQVRAGMPLHSMTVRMGRATPQVPAGRCKARAGMPLHPMTALMGRAAPR
jgi:hypothetical protein